MRNRNQKILLRLLSVAVICLLLFAGCTDKTEYPPELSPSVATPPPVHADEDGTLTATLFYRSADGQLGAEKRDVEWLAGTSRAQAAVRALFDDPDSTGLEPVIPEGLVFDSVELSGDVCDVYLKGYLPQNYQSFLIARAAIAATVKANEGIGYTDVLVNGMQPGFDGRPVGVTKPIEISLGAYLSQYMTTESPTGAEAGTLISRDAQLYFLDESGQYLLCDVRTLRYDQKAEAALVVSALLGELMKGPVDSEGREPVLPTDMRLMKCEVSSTVEEGQTETVNTTAPCVAELHFSKPAAEYDARKVYASIVYTVTGFWPGVEGVRIYMDDELIYPGDALDIDTQRSEFLRGDFDGVLGHTAKLAFPDQEGLGLYSVLRCMGQDTVYDPLSRLRALFEGTADLGVSLTMFAPEDVLSVSIQGNMAVVNWRGGFAASLKNFVENGVTHLSKNARARMVVYALVNTMANIPGVQRVWMLEEGQRIDKTIDNIYLGNALLYNPGLMLT